MENRLFGIGFLSSSIAAVLFYFQTKSIPIGLGTFMVLLTILIGMKAIVETLKGK